ncbi:MAG: hypothetical protein EU539_05070 [Promethearchaeota archaeon]|nr:MAG: hypothetical protein EU539_05070 [Candidatus Lokiarchaeota archaeon]
MSKIKKKPIDRSTTTISKEDIRFEKVIKNAGWFFLFSLGIFVVYYGIFDFILELIEIEITAMIYSYVIFSGTSSAFCFALSTKISKNRDRKKEIFLDWLLAEFIVSIFAIFSVAIYQW